MNVTEAIYSRRATRSFTDRLVEEPVLRKLLEAAVQAPSAMNAQPWKFAVVQNRDQLHRYSELSKRLMLAKLGHDAKGSHYAERLKSPAFNVFYDASTLVAIGVDEPYEYGAADCWLAAQNLMLAATELGLGTCCIGFAVPALNYVEVKPELGFAKAAVIHAPIIVGYPTSQPPPVPRQSPLIRSWSR